MNTVLFVCPARPDLTVLMPDREYQRMPAEGVRVNWSPYYAQLLRHGDIVETTDVELAPKPAVTASKSSSSSSSTASTAG